MRISDQAIVLQAIKHGDKKSIVKLYTKHHGSISVVAYVSKAPSSKVKSSTLLPLSLIDVALVLKENKDLHPLNETSCYFVNNGISNNFEKLAIAQFMNEVLLKTLKEQSANEHLFEFIETCIKYLNDSESDFLNLHVYFLIEFSKYLGFEPQNNLTATQCYFDCREGRFTSHSLAMPLGLNKEDSKLFAEFLKTNSLKTKLSYLQRQSLLDILLAYYKLHVPAFQDLRSLEVLREIFAEKTNK